MIIPGSGLGGAVAGSLNAASTLTSMVGAGVAGARATNGGRVSTSTFSIGRSPGGGVRGAAVRRGRVLRFGNGGGDD